MRTDHQSLAEGLRARRQLLQSGTPEEANAVIVGQSLGVPLLAPIHEGGIAYAEAIQYVRLRHDHLDQVLDAYRMELSEKRSETARHFALEDIPRYLPALFENSATMTTDEIATQIQRYTKNTCISGRLVERFLREYRDLQREGRFLGPPYLVERQLGVWASENEKPGDYG